jgi:hypothetical protein
MAEGVFEPPLVALPAEEMRPVAIGGRLWGPSRGPRRSPAQESRVLAIRVPFQLRKAEYWQWIAGTWPVRLPILDIPEHPTSLDCQYSTFLSSPVSARDE